MTKKETGYFVTTIGLSRESVRQAEELQEAFGESRSRVISRALDLLYTQHQYQKDKK